METSGRLYSVKQSDSSSTLRTYWEEPNQANTDNITNYYDRPKYVVDILGGAVSKTYRRLSEHRNHRHTKGDGCKGKGRLY